MKIFRIRIVFSLLVAFLILTFASAFAQTDETVGTNACAPGWTNGFYDKYAGLESSFGSYDEWPSYAKEELLPFFDANSAEELDSILVEKYGEGRIDMVTLYSVLVGDYNAIPTFWNEESRIRYSDLLMKYNLPSIGWIDMKRPDDIMTPDEAIKQAQKYIVDIDLSSPEEIDQLEYYWSYGRTAEQNTACYEISIYVSDDDELISCYVFPDFTVKETIE